MDHFCWPFEIIPTHHATLWIFWPNTSYVISQLWDLIETWGFREDIKDIVDNDPIIDDHPIVDDDPVIEDDNNNNNNNNNSNNDKGISALGLDRNMGFS